MKKDRSAASNERQDNPKPISAHRFVRGVALSRHQELFQKYRIDRTPAAFEELVRACRPLVASVCWRYLRRPEDADDAIQETFLKLAANVGNITGDVSSWLTATAYAASVDLIRRAARERRRRETRGQLDSAIRDADLRRQFLHEAIRLHLDQALLELDATARELLIERYFRKMPLRVIAGTRKLSVATASRRVTEALGELASMLHNRGVKRLDAQALIEHFGDPAVMSEIHVLTTGPDPLRFAADWSAALHGAHAQQPMNQIGPFRPGWSRRIRVGCVVSYLTAMTMDINGLLLGMETQVRTMEQVIDPAFQLVAIAEAGTASRALVERTMREYELIGGLIDAADADALKTLDIIHLGQNRSLRGAAAAAFVEAVSSGVGLLNEWYAGNPESADDDPNIRALMLSASPIYAYHAPPRCGTPLPATVRQAHPLLASLREGDRLELYGCGPVYRPVAGAQVLIEKDLLISSEQHRIAELGTVRMPAYLVGTLGQGRVVAAHAMMPHRLLAAYLGVSAAEYFTNLLTWLAEPRREM